MADLEAGGLTWRKSSRSEDANCVEVAISSADVLVRHSQDHQEKIITLHILGMACLLGRRSQQ